MRLRLIFFSIATLMFIVFLTTSCSTSSPIVFVHDRANLIPEDIEKSIQVRLSKIESDTTAEFVVVTVESLEGATIDKYAFELFNDWGIGKKDKNNGVLLLVAPNERMARIEIGLGLEKYISNDKAREILNAEIFPPFRSGDMVKGIEQGVIALEKEIRLIYSK